MTFNYPVTQLPSYQILVIAFTVAALLMCSAPGNSELKLHLSVPPEIAAQAALRVAGDATAPAPVLILHGLEFGANEGFRIEVLGEPGPNMAPVALAVTSLVGHSQRNPQPPLRKIDFPVPLNDSAAQLLANHNEVTIIVRFERLDPERPPVKVDSVFFAPAAQKAN